MSKFIKLTKKDGGAILVNLEHVYSISDDIEHGYSVVVLDDRSLIVNIVEKANEIFMLINQQ